MPQTLPIPPHFDAEQVGAVWKVDYQATAQAAAAWAKQQRIAPASQDRFRVCLVVVDVQNTFCIPGYELYVGGRSGQGAVNDNRRLCEFLYRNLRCITQIVPTMDTHQALQIFHSIFLVDEQGHHPEPYTLITAEDVEGGRWRFNAVLSQCLGLKADDVQRHLAYYARQLARSGKYALTVWPYHAMLGGIGHALVSSLEEAVFFHTMARYSQPDIHLKGNHPLTEHYSVMGPEVDTGRDGTPLVEKSDFLYQKLVDFDALLIAGQAKSHCVAWTIADLLEVVLARDRSLVKKVYLLEDCTSPVVVPGVIDYSQQADEAFARFAKAGMHLVCAAEPMATWPGMGEWMAA